MDFSKIEEILGTDKKSTASLAKKEQYIKLMVEVLNDQGISGKSTEYLRKGLTFAGALPIIRYLSGLEKNVAEQQIVKLFKCDLFKSKDRVTGFRVCASLMGFALEEFDIDRRILKECIKIMPSLSKNKREEILVEAPKIVGNYLMGVVSVDTDFPALDSLGLVEIFVNEFQTMMGSILEKIQNEKIQNAPSEKIEKFMLWVDPTRQEKVPHNEAETIVSQNAKETAPYNEEKSGADEKNNVSHNSSKKAVIAVESEQTQSPNQSEPVVNMRAIEENGTAEPDKEAKKGGADIQKKNTENEVCPVKKVTTPGGSEMAQGAALLFNLAESMNTWATKMEDMACKNSTLEKNNDELGHKIEKLQTELAKEKAESLAAQTEIEENKKTIAGLKAQLSEVQRGNAELQVQSTTTHEEIERLNSILSVYSADKENAQREQLNSIAAKLRTEYRDFKDAENDEMTIDLGENFRFQLTQVFKILIKAGIDVEKR